MMKVGFLGGSFDPVHIGHMMVAQDAFENLGLDRLIFIPAAQSPHKDRPLGASAQDRLDMLQAAVADDARFEVSDFELKKGGVSYTIETVRHFNAVFPDARLVWIMGADQLPNLHRWREVEGLVSLVEFGVQGRPGSMQEQDPSIPGLRLHRWMGHLLDISSTEIRDRVRLGKTVRHQTPDGVIALINDRNLYRNTNP